MPLNILFEDPYLMVIDKAAGVVVDSSETQKSGTLQDILENEYLIKVVRGGIVHRLDKDTSGIILVAKTDSALETLQLQFKERMVKKEYLALVHGFIEEEGVITGSILRNPKAREKFIVDERGKESSTGYKPIQRLTFSEERLVEIFPDYSKIQLKKLHTMHYQLFTLLRCFPQTGRTHQIRVHLKYLGYSIVGDNKYGGRKTARLDSRFCKRQFLHAAKIDFYHPMTGTKMSFESPLPEDLKMVLSNLIYVG